MKHSRNMIYKPTAESDELYQYMDHNERAYRYAVQPILANLEKKVLKGIFDTEKAVDAFFYAATNAANLYKKDAGYMFTVTERYTAAVEFLDDFILDHSL